MRVVHREGKGQVLFLQWCAIPSIDYRVADSCSLHVTAEIVNNVLRFSEVSALDFDFATLGDRVKLREDVQDRTLVFVDDMVVFYFGSSW